MSAQASTSDSSNPRSPWSVAADLLEQPVKLTWKEEARPEQLAPPGDDDWMIWYIRGGRGSGKTRTAAEKLAELMNDDPGDYGVIAPTFGEARDICIEGKGSGLLAVLGGEHGPKVKKWNRSIGELYLHNGSLVRITGADEGAPRVQGKNLKGAWCIAGDQLVLTAAGEIPIRDVRPGHKVWTRDGWRSVTAQTLTKRNAPLVRLTAGDRVLECTDDHPIWVAGKGWKRAATIRHGDRIQTWTSCTDRPPGLNGRESVGTTASSSSGTVIGRAFRWLKRSGVRSTALSRLALMSIMSTRTPRTIGQTIWSLWRWAFIADTMLRPMGVRLTPSLLGSVVPARCGPSASPSGTSAATAGRLSTARPPTPPIAPEPTSKLLTISGVERLTRSADVFDLTVDGAHEFFASGFLVHNCDEVGLWRRKAKSRANTRGKEAMEPWEQAWKESIKLAVRLGKAQIICTGTPKRGHPMIKMLMGDPLVRKTLLLTEDNRANLSPAWYAMITAEYEGTTLGRQELFGEVLEDVEGALWTLTLIEDDRVKEADVEAVMQRIVTGVDPSGGVTETGIVKAAKGSDGHYYVWTDLTANGVPNTWAKASIRCHFAEPEGDKIVAEKNQGGDMVESTLRTVQGLELDDGRVVDGTDIPIKLVSASKGKQARAEPISSLYEQHRVHHIGTFGKLEDEMTQWVPDTGQESPNRLDALVWALTELSQGRNLETPPAPTSMTRQSVFMR